jgi:hypothetical protein
VGSVLSCLRFWSGPFLPNYSQLSQLASWLRNQTTQAPTESETCYLFIGFPVQIERVEFSSASRGTLGFPFPKKFNAHYLSGKKNSLTSLGSSLYWPAILFFFFFCERLIPVYFSYILEYFSNPTSCTRFSTGMFLKIFFF